MSNQISEYQQQALDFLNKTGATIKIEYSHFGKHFDDDKEERDIYNVTIERGSRKFTVKFGQSINDSGFYYTKGRQRTDLDRKYLDKEKYPRLATYIKNKIDWSFMNNGKSDVVHYPKAPDEYSVLACLTKYDPGSFPDFCGEFGYDEDSRKAERIYNAVCDEYKNVAMLFNDNELELLQEIQ